MHTLLHQRPRPGPQRIDSSSDTAPAATTRSGLDQALDALRSEDANSQPRVLRDVHPGGRDSPLDMSFAWGGIAEPPGEPRRPAWAAARRRSWFTRMEDRDSPSLPGRDEEAERARLAERQARVRVARQRVNELQQRNTAAMRADTNPFHAHAFGPRRGRFGEFRVSRVGWMR